MDKRVIHSQIYHWVVTIAAIVVLVVLGTTGQFHWSYTLTFLTVACIVTEWLVIRLPQGDSLTLSIIAVLLALVFRTESSTPLSQAVGALEVIVIGSLMGYGLTHRPPLLHLAFYVAHYIWAASVAGATFVLVSEYVPGWLLSSFHLPAVGAYTVVFSLTSVLIAGPFNARVLRGDKLPKADLLYTIFLAPIALIVYYFFETRQLSLVSLLILALPLIGVLNSFRLYISIDTTYGEVSQLYEISQEFVAAMSQEETVQKVGESIAQAISQLILQLDDCLVYAHNKESNEYLLVNVDGEKLGPLIIIPGHGLLGRVAFDSKGTLVNDVSLEDALSSEERRWPAKTAILSHPLLAEGHQVGLLVLVRQGRALTAEEYRLVGIVANQAGVTLHNAQMYEQSRRLADTDRQLGLLNQTAFTQQSLRILGRAQIDQQPAAVLIGDIDNFRIVNNTYGHLTGDKVLAGVAQLMKEIIGTSGIVGRWGGEEYAITLPDVDEHEALVIANQVKLTVQDHVFKSDDGRDVQVTISIGVAIFRRDAQDVESLVKRADRAMYLAKRTGRNKVCLYEDRKELLELVDRESEPVMIGSTVQT